MDTTLAQIRFGTGLSPDLPPRGVEEMLAALAGPDLTARALPIEPYAARAEAALTYRAARRDRRNGEAELALFERLNQQMRADQFTQAATTMARAVASADGLRERLTWFWADHFTTVGNRAAMRGSITAYVEDAIRPHVGGRFGDMLEAAILHPVMVLYLDQEASVGPNSQQGLRRGQSLNENLARELLELHTAGVGSGYTQSDVRQMAELLTGVGIARGRALVFRPGNAEPGPEIVMGRAYGGAEEANIGEVRAALQDLALRPETARHISGKLADYFVSDQPDDGLIAALSDVFLQTGGDLGQVMGALMRHPAAAQPGPGRVKRPFHFIASSLRALGMPAEAIAGAEPQRINTWLHLPLIAMGQRWQGAAGPDGHFDDDPEWIRPQALAARIGWAMSVAGRLGQHLPDPRDFVETALADRASEGLRWAAARAETRAEGIGLVLAAPEFQRS